MRIPPSSITTGSTRPVTQHDMSKLRRIYRFLRTSIYPWSLCPFFGMSTHPPAHSLSVYKARQEVSRWVTCVYILYNIYIYIYLFIYLFICLCIYVFIYLYMNIQNTLSRYNYTSLHQSLHSCSFMAWGPACGQLLCRATGVCPKWAHWTKFDARILDRKPGSASIPQIQRFCEKKKYIGQHKKHPGAKMLSRYGTMHCWNRILLQKVDRLLQTSATLATLYTLPLWGTCANTPSLHT